MSYCHTSHTVRHSHESRFSRKLGVTVQPLCNERCITPILHGHAKSCVAMNIRSHHSLTDYFLPALAASIASSSLTLKARTAIEHLKLSTYHVLGHGTGAAAAVGIARASGRSSSGPTVPETRAEGVLSATLASPILGGTALPSDFLESLRAPYTRGGNEVCYTLHAPRVHHAVRGNSWILDDFSLMSCVLVGGFPEPSEAGAGPYPL